MIKIFLSLTNNIIDQKKGWLFYGSKEKFDQILNEVSFDKKKVFEYLEAKNTFPSIPDKKKFLFIPIIIDEKINELSIFSNNQIFDNWNEENKSYYLIDYILPTEDLEDLSEGLTPTPEPVAAVEETTEEEDDALSYFQKLAEE